MPKRKPRQIQMFAPPPGWIGFVLRRVTGIMETVFTRSVYCEIDFLKTLIVSVYTQGVEDTMQLVEERRSQIDDLLGVCRIDGVVSDDKIVVEDMPPGDVMV